MNLYREEMKHVNQTTIRHNHPFDVDMSIFSLLRLYVLIEKRGFYIKIRGEQVTCPENLKFALQVETKNFLEV
jgi:hypothetical protein